MKQVTAAPLCGKSFHRYGFETSVWYSLTALARGKRENQPFAPGSFLFAVGMGGGSLLGKSLQKNLILTVAIKLQTKYTDFRELQLQLIRDDSFAERVRTSLD